MTALAMILAAAERWPDAVAIEEADGTPVSYAQLIQRANGFAARIRDAAVVEVSATRTADFVARCLGAWIAGRAWFPLDPAEPAPRRELIRQRVATIVDTDLAYAIPTSGSSGVPKVVMVGHAGLPALLRAQIAMFELAPGARALWLHAPVFDASISDWATALVSGATLVCPAVVDLAELPRRAITHVDLPPVLLDALVHRTASFFGSAATERSRPPALRVVVLGGEAVPVDRVRELARAVKVVVVYGPTEATVCTSMAVVDEHWARPLIGEPIEGVRYRIIDGELQIAGACLARGYAGDPAETALRFRDDWYRTGDRVERTAAGIAFAGRIDRQVKLRGRRVELDEIELALAKAPGVRGGAVSLRDRHLVAFVEGEPGDVAAHLRATLPAWMQPARIVVGPLPRTSTGKLDRAALAAQPLPPRRVPSFDEPLAATLAQLWCDALGTDGVAEGDRFRDAGGDSLAAVSLVAAAGVRGFALDAALLAGNPTFVELLGAARRGLTTGTMSVAECERRGLVALDRALSANRTQRIPKLSDDDVVLPPALAQKISQRIALAEPTARMRPIRTTQPGIAPEREPTPVVAPEPAAAPPISKTEPTTRMRRLTGDDHIIRGHAVDEVLDPPPVIEHVRTPFGAHGFARAAGPHDLVLFTGATGLLGAHLVNAWRARDPRPIAALVREAGRFAGEVIVGDLAQPWLGLDPEAWATLAGRVGTIVHAGARMELPLDWEAHAATNVDGTAWIARLAREAGADLHHISTLAVFVGTDRGAGRCARDDNPDATAIAYGGYAQTKIAAEAIARASGARIYRLGLLVEDAPRAGTQLGMIARGLRKLGGIPRIDAQRSFDATPVEVAAEAIAALATTGGTHHIAGRRASFGELAGGLPLAADWEARAQARLDDPDIAMAYLSLSGAHRAFDLFVATGMDFDTAPVAPFALAPRLL